MTSSAEKKYDIQKWKLYHVDKPFRVNRMMGVLNENFANRVYEEANSLTFEPEWTDLFSISRTQTFAKNTYEEGSALRYFHRFADTKLRKVMSTFYKVNVNGKISYSCTKYNKNDYLLCHDDKFGDRFVAFIYYLNKTWNDEWGGSLDLFDKDEASGQPGKVVFRLFPKFNSLVFFKVGNDTYHQVSEVLTDIEPRLAISGWFYCKEARKIPDIPYHETVIFTPPYTEDIRMRYIHPMNLEEKCIVAMKKHFSTNGSMTVTPFLTPYNWDEITKHLKLNVQWAVKGPANRRCYKIPKELSPFMDEFVKFFGSNSFCEYLEKVAGLDEKNQKITGFSVELQKWNAGCYTTVTDDEILSHLQTLDVYLFLYVSPSASSSRSVNTLSNGNRIYIDSKTSDVKCELEPRSNSLDVFLKDDKITKFILYINQENCMEYYVLAASYQLSSEL